MSEKKLRVLMVIEQCNPEWASVPLVGYNFYEQISQLVDVTLVTHQRNKPALDKVIGGKKIFYISEGALLEKYYKFADKLANQGAINWPLYHLLTYPIYASFNRKVYSIFNKDVRAQKFDLVHAMTPMMPRYPVKLIEACNSVPFVLGPVNGGVPFPKGFEKTARKENAHLNFIRSIGRFLIPGYRATYQKADHVFVGSTYTLNMLKEMFDIPSNRLSLFFENGISSDFLKPINRNSEEAIVKLLFVGRLVPYKGADMLIEAINQLKDEIKNRVRLIIVGDGAERPMLEKMVQELNLSTIVNFTGWINQSETVKYYTEADVFCFPSIREFGGAVVLEAMACGLPCIVVNNGGVGEYVTEETGFRIEPISRSYIIQLFAEEIETLTLDSALRQSMSASAINRASIFEWSIKAGLMVGKYNDLLLKR